MSLIDFIRALEESQDDFDVELEEFDADSEQADPRSDESSGRSYGRLVLVALLLVGIAYLVYRFRPSSSEELYTDIELDDDEAHGDESSDDETGDDATVSVEHDPEDAAETAESAAEVESETESDDDDAVEVEIESPDDETDEE